MQWRVHRETSRTLGERYREHLKEPSPMHVYSLQTVHNATSDNFYNIGREDQGLARTIKESIYIRVNNPTLNRNVGKFNLNHIWDRVLHNTPGLKINIQRASACPVHSNQWESIPTNGHPQISIGHSGHALNSEHVLKSDPSINKYCKKMWVFLRPDEVQLWLNKSLSY